MDLQPARFPAVSVGAAVSRPAPIFTAERAARTLRRRAPPIAPRPIMRWWL
jgi:hypothetical protein